MTLALISNIANYLKYNYFWDCDGIDNVTLRLWKFSDFCSRHTVGVAGDDIMFHILVCLCVCIYVCHDVCPEDLTMKEWCHTNNILQVHCWECLVVQVMFHARMKRLMTSQGHKLGQILKLIYLYLSQIVDQKLKISEMLMAIFLAYSTSGREFKMAAILNLEILNTASIWPHIWKDCPKLCQKEYFLWWRHPWRHKVASKSALYIPV